MAHTHHKCARRRGGGSSKAFACWLEVFRMPACWQTAPIADCVVGGPAKGIKESGGFWFICVSVRAGTFLAGCSCWCLGTAAGMEIVMHFVLLSLYWKGRSNAHHRLYLRPFFYCFCSKRSSKIKAFETHFLDTSETRNLNDSIQGQGHAHLECWLGSDSNVFWMILSPFLRIVFVFEPLLTWKKCVPIVMQMCAGSLIRLPASWSSINEMIWFDLLDDECKCFEDCFLKHILNAFCGSYQESCFIKCALW